jgi:hypothetical protein
MPADSNPDSDPGHVVDAVADDSRGDPEEGETVTPPGIDRVGEFGPLGRRMFALALVVGLSGVVRGFDGRRGADGGTVFQGHSPALAGGGLASGSRYRGWSLLFVGVHATVTVGSGGEALVAGLFFGFGVVLGVSYHLTENLLVPVIGHAVFNGAQTLTQAADVAL